MRLIALVILIVTSVYVQAQGQDRRQAGREEIESYKIAYLTEKLNLSPEKAEKFWPIYNEFGDKRHDLRVERSKLRLDLSKSEISESDADRIIATELSLRKKEIELEEEYYNKFKNVLSSMQVIALLKAEMDFNREMLRRLRQRRDDAGGDRR